MMKTKIVSVVALVSITLSMTLVVGALGVIALTPHEATAQEQAVQEFDAILAGGFEVPPVQSNAAGFAELETEEGSDNLEYGIIVVNIANVTQAHIHQGNSSQAGPIVASLFNASTPTGPLIGDLTEGSITSADLMGPLQGKQLSDLIALMQNGQAYVNVHTAQNPDGEIRGTIELDTD
ncbi:MAG TPA: CHRD domain-containing protein [Nitrososphaera sp.]|nr:CHRD domain-containing protein [Nitrososphaera sp.]